MKYNVCYYYQDSFEHTKTWLNEVDRYASADVSKILVGNRCHLVEKKVVDFTTAQVKYTLCMCASIYQCISFTNIFFPYFLNINSPIVYIPGSKMTFWVSRDGRGRTLLMFLSVTVFLREWTQSYLLRFMVEGEGSTNFC